MLGLEILEMKFPFEKKNDGGKKYMNSTFIICPFI